MPAAPKRAKRVRKSAEFDLVALTARLRSLRANAGAYSWSLTEIQQARDSQMAGNFRSPARLAESFLTDDALYTAHRTRLAPQAAIPVRLEPANGSASARLVADEADGLFGPAGAGLTPETLYTLSSQLANHGVAIATCTTTPRDDGSRIDLEVHAWPIEWVRWDPTLRSFVTQVDADTALGAGEMRYGGEVTITHGDGRWIVVQRAEVEPWKDCCLLPAALVWARHAFGFAAWNRATAAHGNAKVIGELPEGTPIDSAEGAAFLDLLVAISSAEMPVGIKPRGSAVEYLVNTSDAWQIFKELVSASKVSASQIYLGQDGSLGTNPTGPGVDLRSLLGVTNDIVEGDLHALERALFTGAIQVWTALNFGDSSLAPQRLYQIPDADQDARRKSEAEQRVAFYDAVRTERALGFDVTAERIASLADGYGVTAAALAATSAKPSIALAPPDIAKVVLVNEARAGAGLGPLLRVDGSPDPAGLLTVSAFTAQQDAVKSVLPLPAAAAAPTPAPRANGAAAVPAAPPPPASPAPQ